MGPYGSVGAHVKTGRSPMAQDHLTTPRDPKMAYKHQTIITQKQQKKHYQQFAYFPWLADVCKVIIPQPAVLALEVCSH